MEAQEKRSHTQLSPSSPSSSSTKARFLPRHTASPCPGPTTRLFSFPKSCHVGNQTSAQAGQRRRRCFLLGSAFSFSLRARAGRESRSVVLHPGTRLPSAGGSLFTGFLRLAPTFSLARAPDLGLWKHCLSCPQNPLEKRGQKHCQCSALLGKACWAGAPRG